MNPNQNSNSKYCQTKKAIFWFYWDFSKRSWNTNDVGIEEMRHTLWKVDMCKCQKNDLKAQMKSLLLDCTWLENSLEYIYIWEMYTWCFKTWFFKPFFFKSRDHWGAFLFLFFLWRPLGLSSLFFFDHLVFFSFSLSFCLLKNLFLFLKHDSSPSPLLNDTRPRV